MASSRGVSSFPGGAEPVQWDPDGLRVWSNESAPAHAQTQANTDPEQVREDTFAEFEDDNEETQGKLATHIAKIQIKLSDWYERKRGLLVRLLYIVLILLYAVYFGCALYYSWRRAMALIVFTLLALVVLLWMLVKHLAGDKLTTVSDRLQDKSDAIWKYAKWVVLVLFLLGILLFIIFDARYQPVRLVSATGILVYLILAWIISKHRFRVPWRMVVSGVFLQLVMGLFMLRWDKGLQAFQFIGDQAIRFLSYTDAGSRFVFGEAFVYHEFVFIAMPPVVFFSAVVSLLYYWGVLQFLIQKYGIVMEIVMRVGPIEAFVSAANVFLGPNTSVLTIRHFVGDMTMSELHCVMVAGFATVAGSLFGAYLSFGVPPAHLISASVLSAPAALVMAKMLYPEVKQSRLQHVKSITFKSSEANNPIAAFSDGASDAISIVVNIVANLIGFVAALYFFNATLAWFGDRVGIDLSFQIICSYLFVPLPYIMGIEPADCLQVARLIGTKLFLTDIVGYIELGKLIDNRQNGLLPAISPRSEIIATYALCGFANLPDVGICLGAIGAIVPSRRGDLAVVAVRAMVAGNLACFLTASMAGFLYAVE